MTASSRPYVLVSAHHCAPDMGSEHAVGWNLVSKLARGHPLLLITQDNEYRFAVEAGVKLLRQEGCRIEAFFVRHGTRTDGRANDLRLVYYLTYRQYQQRVLNLARQLESDYDIAAVHHLTIVGFREPGYLWMLGLPFVWGPVGGLVSMPKCLYTELPLKSRILQCVRATITYLQFRYSARVAKAYRASQRPGSAFVSATEEIGARFVKRFGGQFHWIPETGSHDAPSRQARTEESPSTPIRLLWAGALVDRKPMAPLLDAIARISDHQAKISLTVLGDGESRPRFETLAKGLNINASFRGWRPHEEVRQLYARADVFVLLSALDLTTNVVFEALSAGLPVLCMNHHGYSDIVTAACGIKIPVSGGEQLRQNLVVALTRLIESPSALEPMKVAARQRALQFSWERNASLLSALYDRAVEQRRLGL